MKLGLKLQPAFNRESNPKLSFSRWVTQPRPANFGVLPRTRTETLLRSRRSSSTNWDSRTQIWWVVSDSNREAKRSKRLRYANSRQLPIIRYVLDYSDT